MDSEETTKHDLRLRTADHIRRLLIGPIDGETETVLSDMRLRYMLGVLFARNSQQSDLTDEALEGIEDGQDAGGSNEEFGAEIENPLSLANQELPSSVGVSFVVSEGSSIYVTVSGARYQRISAREWKRSPLNEEIVKFAPNDVDQKQVFDGCGIVNCIFRPIDNGYLITVSLLNTQENEKNQKINWERCLFQVGLSCEAVDGELKEYGTRDPASLDLEEQIEELQFNSQPYFGVGHGASCAWSEEQNKVWVEYLPSQFVHRPTYDDLIISGEHEQVFQQKEVFSLEFLSNETSYPAEASERLNALCDFYESWISQFAETSFDSGFSQAVAELDTRAKYALSRMRSAIDLIATDKQIAEAFRLANLAMLNQMANANFLEQEKTKRHDDGAAWPIPANEQFRPDRIKETHDKFLWRPFQLAFCLLVISSLAQDDAADERDLVDLIWFTTGGGKTEAYLLVAAFEIIRRRLCWKEKGGGTSVITRYTYRFLTADQFSRTARLICALEQLRRAQSNLGSEPITLGLWVGGGVTPNRLAHPTDENSAERVFDRIINSKNPREAGSLFQINECPNCGTALLPDKAPDNGLADFGFEVTSATFKCFCPNKSCEFNSSLPIAMVDDDLYRNPPTFLIGTIDKFANLPLKEEAASFLGKGSRNFPPSLIIQDELHLISGPLGTIAAVYEAGLDETIKYQFKEKGLENRAAKYIASTATIANAADQVQRLFGRRLALFPPRGISSTDSFFSKEDRSEDTARLYLGVMPQALRSTSAAHWTSAAIIEAVDYVKVKEVAGNKSEVDFLWSLLCYCNSKRELGLLNRSINGEIEDRVRVYRDAVGEEIAEPPRSDLKKREVSADAVKNVAEVRRELGQKGQLDVVPCTNMVSVGIDINRLGLMMVNGQPKGTSEYIQATSRVGRRPKDVGPGLVVTLYSPSKPRDRSHYEQFKNYHGSLYRMVEPTSVTPGSQPALERALHGALVTFVRFACGLSKETEAADFKPSNFAELLSNFVNRLKRCYPEGDEFDYERRQIDKRFQSCINEWEQETRRSHGLRYVGHKSNQQNRFLLSQSDNGLWQALYSMRNVDASIEIKIRQRR